MLTTTANVESRGLPTMFVGKKKNCAECITNPKSVIYLERHCFCLCLILFIDYAKKRLLGAASKKKRSFQKQVYNK